MYTRERGKESPYPKEKAGGKGANKIPLLQVEQHFMHTARGNGGKVTVVTMVDTERVNGSLYRHQEWSGYLR